MTERVRLIAYLLAVPLGIVIAALALEACARVEQWLDDQARSERRAKHQEGADQSHVSDWYL